MRSSGDRRIGVALAAGVLVVGIAFAGWPQTRPGGLLRDFNAFYCAGAALARGADPYRAEPLGACERSPRPAWLSRTQVGLAVPAPLPPYALAPFALIARLPYAVAGALWTVILLGALGATGLALRRATSLPWLIIWAALALGDGYAAITLGQIAPVSIAALAIAMLLLERDRDELAAVAAAVATFEPHIGLPACLALFVWRPRTRIPLVGLGLAAAGASCLPLGPRLALEYVRDVLPGHALSEIVNVKQLSLTYALHRAGFGDAVALRLGELSFAAMTLLGVVSAGFLARRTLSPGFIVALPAAFALIGGPFIHIVQIAAALPAALLLYARVPAQRPIVGWAIVGLAVPWVQFTTLGSAFPILASLVCGALTVAFGARPAIALATALGAYGFIALLSRLIVTRVPDAAATLLAHYDPRALAEASWSLYVRTVATTDPAAYDIAKIPTWAALCALAATGVAVTWPYPGVLRIRAAKKGPSPAAESP